MSDHPLKQARVYAKKLLSGEIKHSPPKTIKTIRGSDSEHKMLTPRNRKPIPGHAR